MATATIALDPYGKAIMTRDMELIRKIIAEIQSRKEAKLKPLDISSFPEAVVARHLEMMLDAGLIEGAKSDGVDAPFPTIYVKDLTWSGHDFAGAIMNDTIWAKLKKQLSPSELATIPLPLLKDLGVALLGQLLKDKLGLS
jgi:hypothetical protein